MPTYEYLCQECGQRLEVFQKFSAKALRVHPECGGRLQKIFHPSGVVFKGSGYYVNDSRSNGSGAQAAKKESTSTNGRPDKAEKAEKADKSPSDTGSRPDKKPAKTSSASDSATAAD